MEPIVDVHLDGVASVRGDPPVGGLDGDLARRDVGDILEREPTHRLELLLGQEGSGEILVGLSDGPGGRGEYTQEEEKGGGEHPHRHHQLQ